MAADPRPARTSPTLLLLVLLGGAVGAPLRYALNEALPLAADGFPTATFVTNIVGAGALGLLLEASAGLGTARRQALRAAVGTGLLGAFTTYSALAVEVALLSRHGQHALAAGYGLLSTVAGLLAAALGIGAAKASKASGAAKASKVSGGR